MDIGFIILGYDGEEYKIKTTLKSISNYYGSVKCLVVIPSGIKKPFKESIVGGKSFTSLINEGMSHAPAEWNIIVLSGVHVREKLDEKYSVFYESRKDIFFPLIWGNDNFLDASLNGLTFHRDTFKEVGNFATNEDSLEICKLMWFLEATDKGCKFKAIANTKMA